jgi:hypothetical protein
MGAQISAERAATAAMKSQTRAGPSQTMNRRAPVPLMGVVTTCTSSRLSGGPARTRYSPSWRPTKRRSTSSSPTSCSRPAVTDQLLPTSCPPSCCQTSCCQTRCRSTSSSPPYCRPVGAGPAVPGPAVAGPGAAVPEAALPAVSEALEPRHLGQSNGLPKMSPLSTTPSRSDIRHERPRQAGTRRLGAVVPGPGRLVIQLRRGRSRRVPASGLAQQVDAFCLKKPRRPDQPVPSTSATAPETIAAARSSVPRRR